VVKAPDRRQEAARWFAKERRGVMSLDERTACEAWRAEAANAAALRELERSWALVEVARSEFAGEIIVVPAARPKRFVRPALIAAVCIASLGLGAMSYSGSSGFWTKLDWQER